MWAGLRRAGGPVAAARFVCHDAPQDDAHVGPLPVLDAAVRRNVLAMASPEGRRLAERVLTAPEDEGAATRRARRKGKDAGRSRTSRVCAVEAAVVRVDPATVQASGNSIVTRGAAWRLAVPLEASPAERGVLALAFAPLAQWKARAFCVALRKGRSAHGCALVPAGVPCSTDAELDVVLPALEAEHARLATSLTPDVDAALRLYATCALCALAAPSQQPVASAVLGFTARGSAAAFADALAASRASLDAARRQPRDVRARAAALHLAELRCWEGAAARAWSSGAPWFASALRAWGLPFPVGGTPAVGRRVARYLVRGLLWSAHRPPQASARLAITFAQRAPHS